MPVTSAIHDLLRAAHVPYTVVPHWPAFTAQEGAGATHLPGRDSAKVVVFVVDGEPIHAMLPAPMTVNLRQLLELAGGHEVRPVEEDELRRLFPEGEPGAVPPFGSINGHTVFVDVALASEPQLVLSAETHTEAIAMRWNDFARSVRPIVGRFAAEPRLDRVGAFVLSFRE